MKTLKCLFGLLFLVALTVNLSQAAITIPGQTEIIKLQKAEQSFCVKAIRFKGVLMPSYDLPVVEIFANRSESKNEIENKKTEASLLTADLPTIEISADRINGQQQFSYFKGGERIFLAYLPEINIVSDYEVKPTMAYTQAGIKVINLPVITIIGESFTNPRLNAQVLGIVEIDETKLPKIGNTEFAALLVDNSQSNIFIGNSDWFYVTLKKCGINPTGNEVCEIVRQTKIQTAAILENRVSRLIFKN